MRPSAKKGLWPGRSFPHPTLSRLPEKSMATAKKVAAKKPAAKAPAKKAAPAKAAAKPAAKKAAPAKKK